MARKLFTTLAVAWLIAGAGSAHAVVDLADFGVNIDGATYCGLGPCDNEGLSDLSGVPGVDDGGFDFGSGLGSIVVEVTGAGGHSVMLFLDHEIDEGINTFFNEFGAATGSTAAGQSWEIDEPGFLFGDIYDNFLANSLDDSNGVPAGGEDDVSMAMRFGFNLAADEIARITFELTQVMPTGGFFLSHTDPDSDESLYFTSSLSIRDIPTGVVAPGVPALLGAGLLLLAVSRRR